MNEVQECYLRLIALSSVEDFDGERCVADLRAHPSLWDSAVPSDFQHGGYTLRDIPEGHNHARFIALLTDTYRAPALMGLARGWDAAKVDAVASGLADNYLGQSGGPVRHQAVVRVWLYRPYDPDNPFLSQ